MSLVKTENLKEGIKKIKISDTIKKIKLGFDLVNTINKIPNYSEIFSPIISGGIINFRINNLENMISIITKKIEENEDKINKEGYNEVETIKILKKLIEEIEFEESKEKIKILSEVFVKFFYEENIKDKNKIIVISKLAELSIAQMEILKSIGEVSIKCKQENRDIIKSMIIENMEERNVEKSVFENFYEDLDLLSSLGLIDCTERSLSIFTRQLGEIVIKYLQLDSEEIGSTNKF